MHIVRATLEMVPRKVAETFAVFPVLFDPTATQTVHAHDLHGNCDYTLLEGRTLRGRVEKVFLRGTLIVDGPRWLGREGMGRFVPRGQVRAF